MSMAGRETPTASLLDYKRILEATWMRSARFRSAREVSTSYRCAADSKLTASEAAIPLLVAGDGRWRLSPGRAERVALPPGVEGRSEMGGE